MACSFCNRHESNYQQDRHIEKYICSGCTLTFVGANQESLKRGHAKAIKLGYTDKAQALKFFIHKEDNCEQRNSKRKKRLITKYSYRKRDNRIARPVKKSVSEFKNKQTIAFSESEPERPALSGK